MKYRFISVLPSDEIRARLRSRAHPMKKGWRMTGNTLFYGLDGSSFTLIKTGSFGAAGGQPSFVGRITDVNGETVIEGRFRPDRKQTRWITIFCILCILAPLFFLGVHAMVWIIFLPFYTIWVCALFLGLFWGLAPRFWKKAGTSVLTFIEENLLC